MLFQPVQLEIADEVVVLERQVAVDLGVAEADDAVITV